MLGYLVGGFLRLLLRFWTFGFFYFLENRLFLWMKDIATPRLSYKKTVPFEKATIGKNNRKVVDSRLCLLNSSQNSWNSFFLSNFTSSRKLPFIWIAKTVIFSSRQTPLPFKLDKSAGFNNYKLDKSAPTKFPWNLHSVSKAARMEERNLKTDAMCEANYCVASKEILPSYFGSEQLDMGFLEHCVYKDFCDNIIQKEKEKMELLKPHDTVLCVGEKHCSSAASIDSGYQSFQCVDSACTCIEEDGVTLFVSDCRYNKEGKLISMTVGFGFTEGSNSTESLVFDNELCDSESEEDFIVFGADPCDEKDECCFDHFVYEGTADQISLAMSLDTSRLPTLEITVSQTLPKSYPQSCPFEEDNCKSLFNDYKSGTNNPLNIENNTVNDKKYIDNSEIRTDISSNSAGTVHTKKKVQFQVNPEIHEIIAWDFAYRQARKGHWKNYATDRLQFQRRINQTAKIIEPVLQKKMSQMKI